MQVNLELSDNMRITAKNKKNHITNFDTVPEFGGENSAATPMEIMLQALGACSMIDVASIIRKKRKELRNLSVVITAERAEDHPKVFTKVHLVYTLESKDAETKDLERAVELSQNTYCSASAMFKKSGCLVTSECIVVN